jgi:hypothetical protein
MRVSLLSLRHPARLQGCKAAGGKAAGCKAEGGRLRIAGLQGAGCTLQGSRLQGCRKVAGCRLQRALRAARLQAAKLQAATCILQVAKHVRTQRKQRQGVRRDENAVLVNLGAQESLHFPRADACSKQNLVYLRKTKGQKRDQMLSIARGLPLGGEGVGAPPGESHPQTPPTLSLRLMVQGNPQTPMAGGVILIDSGVARPRNLIKFSITLWATSEPNLTKCWCFAKFVII